MKISGGELLFGKYRYRRLSDASVPTQYLKWIFAEVDLEPDERFALRNELRRRGVDATGNSHNDPRNDAQPGTALLKVPPGVTADHIRRVVAAGRQTLAKRMHPDVGGSVTEMQIINQTCDWLESLVGGVA